MWRDRTNLYISYRQSYAHHPAKRSQYTSSSRTTSNGFTSVTSGGTAEESRGLMSADDASDFIIEMDRLPPRWLDVQDEVANLLEDIGKKMQKLEPMHAKHMLPGFEDDAVKKKEEREIERLTQDITRGFQGCQRAIKSIDNMVKSSKAQPGGINQGEETMAKNLQVNLATKVGEVSAVFRKKQANYLKKLKSLNGMGTALDRSSTPLAANPYTDPSLMESDADRSLSQSTLQQTAMKRRTNNDTAIAQREKEIEDIAQGIIELANIFTELQTMVIDQGTVLDRIDYNIDRMATDVKAADKELTVATSYQKKTTKRKIILLLILIVAGMIILLVVKPKRRGQASPPDLLAPPPALDNPVPP